MITVFDSHGTPLKGITVRVAVGNKGPHIPGPTEDDGAWDSRETEDDAGHVAFPGAGVVAPGICTQGLTVYVNTRNVDARGGQAVVFVPPLPGSTAETPLDPLNDPAAHPLDITLPAASVQPPTPFPLSSVMCPSNGGIRGRGTVQEWKAIAHDIVARLGLTIMERTGGPQPNLDRFEAELKKYDPRIELQFTGGVPVYKRPRVHLPSDEPNANAPCGIYSRPVDFGDFDLPFFHDVQGQTDVWTPIGRAPSSAW